MTKSLRAGKVLIDWSQNDEHKTTVCVYSLRAPRAPHRLDAARAGTRCGQRSATAAIPPLSFDAAEVLERVARRGDLFAPLLSLDAGAARNLKRFVHAVHRGAYSGGEQWFSASSPPRTRSA